MHLVSWTKCFIKFPHKNNLVFFFADLGWKDAVHASIRQENVREDAVARHSIEVRTLVLSGVFEPDGVASDV